MDIKEQIKEADAKLNKRILNFFNDGKDFWTLLAIQYKRIPIPGLGTVTTHITEKGIELLYDPELILNSRDREIDYYIVHESLHLIYRHAYRFAVSDDMVDLATLKKNKAVTKNPKIPAKSSDIAADLIVNRDASDVLGHELVEKMGITADQNVFSPLGYQNTNSTYSYHLDRDRRTMFNVQSEDLEQEVINTYTKAEIPTPPSISIAVSGEGEQKGKSGQGGGEGEGEQKDQNQDQSDGNGNQDQKKDSKQQGKGEGKPQASDNINGRTVNRHLVVDGNNPLQKQLGQHFVEEMIKNAAKQIGKGKGDLPSSVQEELEMIMHPPKKDWRAILRNYVEASIPAQPTKTWARLHRAFPYIRKGKHKRRVPLIGLVMDTSGSVSDAALAAFYREIDSIRKILKTDIELVQCDAAISKTEIISYKKAYKWNVAGRGGTEYIPALEYFDKDAKRKPDVVVFFTDLQVGDGDVPAEPRNYKIIWVSVDKEQCEHFAGLEKYGTFIHLDVDEADEEAVK